MALTSIKANDYYSLFQKTKILAVILSPVFEGCRYYNKSTDIESVWSQTTDAQRFTEKMNDLTLAHNYSVVTCSREESIFDHSTFTSTLSTEFKGDTIGTVYVYTFRKQHVTVRWREKIMAIFSTECTYLIARRWHPWVNLWKGPVECLCNTSWIYWAIYGSLFRRHFCWKVRQKAYYDRCACWYCSWSNRPIIGANWTKWLLLLLSGSNSGHGFQPHGVPIILLLCNWNCRARRAKNYWNGSKLYVCFWSGMQHSSWVHTALLSEYSNS